MEGPAISLLIDKGPRKGMTLEVKPGSDVRIGRILRENTFQIKDPAISQKHLVVEFRDKEWMITDLDTSNGTMLNEVRIPSMEPCTLKNGDTIKIGVRTAITVSILERENVLPATNLRRNTRRQVNAKIDVKKCGGDVAVVERGVQAFENPNFDKEKVLPETRVRRNPRRQAAAASSKVNEVCDFNHGVNTEKGGEDDLGERLEERMSENPNFDTNKSPAKEKNERGKEKNERDKEIVGENLGEQKEIALEIDEGASDKMPESSIDMENITLGQWLDRMERWWPKHIHNITEGAISKMREQAKEIRDLELQQEGRIA
ncbi:FHA domain-containing protein At4g14490 [Amborella trichopoda]|uniref:FHA domain-containing protein n=1 Tax=Amborella trichopoda TaxID=13333 RepID=W1P6A6_AMBTC|nr:FHA domain-containing protein At4g14490 [Amborella trichopoda]ERN03146.1 hypothetical protein AMTR_s00003p00103470 [Amborella trichopoda]|eukprot:XP_006841471.1 FHA domain-containing protein At4g14490 [Amborella trichopoda]